MTLLAALVLAQTPAAASPAAEFFPLVKGTRRTYEKKGEGTLTVVDEVGATAYFEDRPATAIVQKDNFGRVVDTTYYRVDGPTVLIVGYGEDRTNSTTNVGEKGEANVLLPLQPAMPVFKYEGRETLWNYGAVPQVQSRPGEAPRPGEPTEINGVARPGKPRKVLGRTFDTIEVRADVQIGAGGLAQKVVETSVYGRGIGLIESTFKSMLNGKTREIRTKLVSIEEKKDGG